jgi:hypothetical protein
MASQPNSWRTIRFTFYLRNPSLLHRVKNNMQVSKACIRREFHHRLKVLASPASEGADARRSWTAVESGQQAHGLS